MKMKQFSKKISLALPLAVGSALVGALLVTPGCAALNPLFDPDSDSDTDGQDDGDDSRGDGTSGGVDETGFDSDVSGSDPGRTNTTEPPTTGDTDDSVDTTAGDSSTGEPCVGITLTELAGELGQECNDLFDPVLCNADLPMNRSLFAFALRDAIYPYQLAGFHQDYTTNYGEPPEPRFVDVPPMNALALVLEEMSWRGVLADTYDEDDTVFGPNQEACPDWAQPIIDQTLALSELYCVFSENYEDDDVGLNSNFINHLGLTCFGTREVLDDQGEIIESESLSLAGYGPIEVYNDYDLDGIPEPVTDPDILDGVRINCISGSSGDVNLLDGTGSTSFLPDCYSSQGVDDVIGLEIRVQSSTSPVGAFGTMVRLDIRLPKGFDLLEWDPPGVNRTTLTVVEAPK